MDDFNQKTIKEKIDTLRKNDTDSNPSTDGLLVKALIALPILVFFIGFFLVNRPLNIYGIISILCLTLILIIIGVLLLLFMEDSIR